MAHCKKKREKVGLMRHPQLINMIQNISENKVNKYPQFIVVVALFGLLKEVNMTKR